MEPSKKIPVQSFLQTKQSGQVFIEYILLLLVAFSLAALITRQVVSLDPDSPGFLVSKWQAILEQIASDDPNR